MKPGAVRLDHIATAAGLPTRQETSGKRECLSETRRLKGARESTLRWEQLEVPGMVKDSFI